MRGLTLALMTLLAASATAADIDWSTREQPKALTDGDRDGVIDARDRCPDTALGLLVDNYGCPTHQDVALPVTMAVNFSHDSAVVRAQDEPVVAALAAYLKAEPNARVNLAGYASLRGTDNHNQALSEKRVAAIAQLLTQRFGIDPARIQTEAYGEKHPLVANETEAAEAANRRVEGEADELDAQMDVVRWTIYTPGR